MMKLLKGNPGYTKTTNHWAPTQVEIEGVTICSKYKYLETFLAPKLTYGGQITS